MGRIYSAFVSFIVLMLAGCGELFMLVHQLKEDTVAPVVQFLVYENGDTYRLGWVGNAYPGLFALSNELIIGALISDPSPDGQGVIANVYFELVGHPELTSCFFRCNQSTVEAWALGSIDYHEDLGE